MWTDPIVAEVRRARREIENECEEDFEQIYDHAIEVQKTLTTRIISRGDSVPVRVDQEITTHGKESAL